jgi:DnaK suppressor protein
LLSREFVEHQRIRLETLRAELRAEMQVGAREDLQVAAQAGGEAREAEDAAQSQALLESGALLRDRLAGRLVSVDRALAKIGQGHYGYSDISGRRIPRERLEAEPEAACMVQEAAGQP